MADENTFSNVIREYLAANNYDAIISLCESMKSQRDRAERKLELYTHMNAELGRRFAAITEPATGRKVTELPPGKEARPKAERREQVASRTKPKPGIDTSDFTF